MHFSIKISVEIVIYDASAERIKKVPTINKPTKKKFGLPFVSMINEVKVGQSNRAVLLFYLLSSIEQNLQIFSYQSSQNITTRKIDTLV